MKKTKTVQEHPESKSRLHRRFRFIGVLWCAHSGCTLVGDAAPKSKEPKVSWCAAMGKKRWMPGGKVMLRKAQQVRTQHRGCLMVARCTRASPPSWMYSPNHLGRSACGEGGICSGRGLGGRLEIDSSEGETECSGSSSYSTLRRSLLPWGVMVGSPGSTRLP